MCFSTGIYQHTVFINMNFSPFGKYQDCIMLFFREKLIFLATKLETIRFINNWWVSSFDRFDIHNVYGFSRRANYKPLFLHGLQKSKQGNSIVISIYSFAYDWIYILGNWNHLSLWVHSQYPTVVVGEVSEWLKELVSKTSVRFSYRGFESRPLRYVLVGAYNLL